MRLTVSAIGRLKPGPEHDLVERYLARARPLARAAGFAGPDVAEFEARRSDPKRRADDEAAAHRRLVEDGGRLVLLDERGDSTPTSNLAARLAAWRDAGERACVFAIGGADGHAPALRAQADRVLSFGAAVWPHMLVRAMLTEQIYRALTILSGHPYHRS